MFDPELETFKTAIDLRAYAASIAMFSTAKRAGAVRR